MNNKAKPLAITLVFLVVLGLGLWVYRNQSIKAQNESTTARHGLMTDKQFAQSQANEGIMSEADADEWMQTTRAIQQRESITEPELDWLLQELSKPAPSPNPSIAATKRLMIMMSIKQAKGLTPIQKERIYEATIGYLPGPELDDKIGALIVMRHLREVRAIPGVTALLNDPNARVRASAEKTLKAINTPPKV